jgi:hypothetical protein
MFYFLLFPKLEKRLAETWRTISRQITQERTAYKKAATAPAMAKKPTVALPAAPVNSGVEGLVAEGMAPVPVA